MSRGSMVFALSCLIALGLLALRVRECQSAPEHDIIARLAAVSGDEVDRDQASALETWSKAEPGAEFSAGDGLRTGDHTTATLDLTDSSLLEVKSNTLIRFLVKDATPGVDVQSGEAVLRTGKTDLKLSTHIGSFVVKAGSLVVLQRRGDDLGFAVQLGSVAFRDQSGAERTLRQGEEMQVAIGMAMVETSPPPPQEVSALELDIHEVGARGRDKGGSAWRALALGKQTVAPGSELHLPKGVSASVTRGKSRADLRGSGEYVLGVDGALVSAKSGDMSVESADADVSVKVPGGVIVVRQTEGGSKARLRVSSNEGTLDVERGQVSATLNGDTEELVAGDQRRWTPGAEATPAPSDATPGLVAPTYINLAVTAGESFVLHAPELPVSVAFDFKAKCPERGEVQLSGSRQSTRGEGSVNVLFAKGTRSYSVRCINAKGGSGSVTARGTVHVLLDPGTRKLPPLPPTSLAEADGRTYTLYYSNQPPALRLRWPNPPQEKSYVLEVDGKPQSLSGTEHLFKSGELPDGTHSVSFRAGTRRSRTTTIEVRFDNNAPTASVNQPADRSFSAGQAVQIEGVSLQAWKVSLDGGTIKDEPGGRFSGVITPSPARPDIAVRLFHPRRGVHYYLRRAASSP